MFFGFGYLAGSDHVSKARLSQKSFVFAFLREPLWL